MMYCKGKTIVAPKNFVAILFIQASLLLVVLNTFGQTIYYVSSNGSDNNNGLTVNTPFQSIARVNQLALLPGDQVLFRRGDTFRGGLVVLRSGTAAKPIILDAYGTGSKPTISGSIPVSSWTSIGGNIWQATCSQCGSSITGVYDNGVALPLGRYPNLNAPNKGYLTVQSHTGTTQITSKEPLATNWVGGEIVVRPTQWILDRAQITQQNGNSLTLNNSSSYALADGWGYFIQNHLATLDQHGEWYYNASNKTISLYFTQGNPNSHLLTSTIIGEGFTTYNQSYLTIQNLRITETANIGFYAATTNNLTVRNVDVTNAGIDGVQINGSGSNVLFENMFIYKINNNGFSIQQYNGVTFRNNVIRNVGLSPGRGRSGDGQYFGFNSYSEQSVLIENNTLDSLGYIGIASANNNITIQRNTISAFCMTKSDGGGIYTYNGSKLAMSNLHLLNNIIYNAVGAPEGSIYTTYSGANGILLDDCSQNIEVKGNTVFNCTGLGIFLHATTNVIVDGNTSFNNGEGQFVLAHNSNYCPARNNTVQNNIFFSRTGTQSVARYESVDTDLASYGSFDNNYYARPFDDVVKIGAGYKDPNTGVIINGDISLAEWQNLFNKDINSKNSPITFKDYNIVALNGIYKLNSTFNTSNDGWYPYSYYGNGRAIWENMPHLDGGDLQVDFPSPSGYQGSYVFAFNGVGSVSHAKSYILRFDAIASAENKSVQVFLRQRNGTFTDLTPRYSVSVGTTRQSYEIGFTNPIEESDAIVMLKIAEDGKVLWLDNISLQEATLSAVNPDNFIKFLYNPNVRDTTINLSGSYRDVKNQLYTQQITLSPFTSAVLLRQVSPDLTAVITLPQANFSQSGVNNLTVDIFEVSNLRTSSGNVQITITVPVGYSIAFTNSLTSINVSGATSNPSQVDNTKWAITGGATSRQISLKMNVGQFIAANGKSSLGFSITRTTANTGSTSNITVNVNDDNTGAYDNNSLNNTYARIINAL